MDNRNEYMSNERIAELQREVAQKTSELELKTRELKIEEALEKVRAIALSMKDPADMLAVCRLISEQLQELGIQDIRNIQTAIINESKENYLNYEYYRLNDRAVITEVEYNLQPEVSAFVNQMLKDSNSFFTTSFTGGQLKDWLEYQKSAHMFIDPHLEETQSLYYYFYSIGPGALGISTYVPLQEEELEVFRRFRNVFELAYRRYTDVELAIKQAREAKIEAALERVRSRTLAMQKSDELAEAAAVVFKQLIGLGIAPNRLYIGIISGDSGDIEFWITGEDGTRVNFKFTANIHRSVAMAKMVNAWKEHKPSITIDMRGMELADYFRYLGEELHVPFQHGLLQERRIQSIAFFSKGLIGLASPDDQPEETITLLERFAGVFNLTFTRFNDLKLAEAQAEQALLDLVKLQNEKKRAEDALTELKTAQNQLMQSEKMALLGELTAGIAHEIQNPLNFVNNFSEVNTELLDELQQELSAGKTDEARLIVNDIRENEQKINHHGKRAGAIVKAMLQHSSIRSAQKELIDINALAEEYLRLTYHGLRAKDKSFNTTLKTDFEEGIGKVNAVPQDIGRVLLNLLTNAFYAVSVKRRESHECYKPVVSVSTKKTGKTVEISIKDNGNGIPQSVLNKIFQPFFTTKPAGEGTGLGLSLSYDIITKGHGGKLQVETKEGYGSEFIIQLPA